MATKDKLHRLVDQLPDDEILAAERYLEFLSTVRRDPFLHALMNAPLDDEPETEQERVAMAEARIATERGEIVSDEDLRRELGSCL